MAVGWRGCRNSIISMKSILIFERDPPKLTFEALNVTPKRYGSHDDDRFSRDGQILVSSGMIPLNVG